MDLKNVFHIHWCIYVRFDVAIVLLQTLMYIFRWNLLCDEYFEDSVIERMYCTFIEFETY